MKPLVYRIVLMISCVLVFLLCFFRLNQSYDPLARYPYKTEENESIILEHLNSDAIDYIINQQIKPDEFMEFIDVEGFDIHQARSYKVAKQNQYAEKEYIVNFINKYHTHFRRDELKTLLNHYTYLDLTTFYENELVLNDTLSLVNDPSDFKLVLKENQTVYKYSPKLVDWNGIQIQEKMVSDLEEMRNAYSTMLDGQELNITSGYQSYDSLSQEYATRQILYLENTDLFYRSGGQSEFQLGYSIETEYSQLWKDTCYAHINEENEVDYSEVEATLPESARNQMVWLEENAYRYGFILRYPIEKEDVTHQGYQPFVLRYVGKKQAKKMHKNEEVLEEVDTSGWKE